MNFYKDPLDELDTDFSDISDVKPSDLDKILKSAQDLDDEILGRNKDKSKDENKGTKVERKIFDDPLADLGLLSPAKESTTQPKTPSSADKKMKKDTIASLFGLTEDTKLEDNRNSPSRSILQAEVKPRPRSSGDWLGLTESPNIKRGEISSAPVPSLHHQVSLFDQDSNRTLATKSSDVDGLFVKKVASADLSVASVTGGTDKNMDQPKVGFSKRKTNLLDDLFGNDRIRKESKSERKTELSGVRSSSLIDHKLESKEKLDTSYTPSVSSETRLDRNKETSNLVASSSLVGDRFFGVEEKSVKLKSNVFDDRYEAQSTSRQPTSLTKPSPSPKIERKRIPDWLGGTSDKTVQLNSDIPIRSTLVKQPKEPSSTNVPEWLDDNAGENNEQFLSREHLPSEDNNKQKESVQQVTAPGIDGNVITQLAKVQAQLGASMTRHNQNLQACMQVLMNEAQRITIDNQTIIIPNNQLSTTPASATVEEKDNSVNNFVKDEGKEELKYRLEENEERIKEQTARIYDLETNITKLELQCAQLEIKIKYTEEIKDMEIEKLKKGHEFEISNWESQLERLKSTHEEIIADYASKIARLQKKEEETEKEFQKRLETMETERLNDLEKLGEFHRLVMEQSTMISFTTSNLSSSGIRFPFKLANKPADEVELTEREAALLEKERDIQGDSIFTKMLSKEVLKANIEAEKRDLDECIQREKIRREERERELKRALMDIKLKEEFHSKDYERKMEQMKQQEDRLKEMREEALKEQSDISKEKLTLAAEKARLEAAISIQNDPNAPNLNPLDLMRARAEVDAALQAAREAREMADQERRRHIELRKAIEEIGWQQKDKDLQLEMRERHISYMIKEAETKREEGQKALEDAYSLKEELEQKQKEIKESLKSLETKEKVVTKEKLEITKERLELEKHKSQLELLLPELNPAEQLTLNLNPSSSNNYRDPKAVIMRLKAEKDLQDYIAPLRQMKQ